MKNIVIGILLLATLAFGGLYILQSHRAQHVEAGAENLQQNVSDLQSSLAEKDKRAAKLRDQVETARADADAKDREAARLKASLAASLTNRAQPALADTSNSQPANPFAEMFKNPEMKEIIKRQQKAAMTSMLDKNYSKLFSDMHLTPEQTASLKDLILNKQLGAADMGMSMLSGGLDESKRAEMMEQVKASSDAADAKIKEFLGDDNYSQYQTYEKSMGERMAVSGFKDQLGGGANALTPDQEQQLVQTMSQEKQNFKFTTDLSDKSKFNGDFSSMLTEDKMNGFFQEQGQLNQQYLTKAQTILSPDQLSSFGKYLEDQQAMQKMGMQMAAKMFAPAKAAGK